ncbi:MAG: phytanoyl-CoA dioxygenase family protein [Planctomycetota bacterium]
MTATMEASNVQAPEQSAVRTLADAGCSAEELAQFEQDGFLIVRGALAPEHVARLKGVIAAREAEWQSSPDKKSVYGLDIRPIVNKDPAFLALIEHPTTFPKAVRVLGHYNLQLMTSHLIMVPPDPAQRNIGWHRDGGNPRPTMGSGGGGDCRMSLKIGYFLTDLLESKMGSLMVVPGSHQLPGTTLAGWDRQDPPGAIELKVHAGDAVIFENRVYHAGAVNHSAQTRVVLYYGYGYRWLKPIDYGGAFPEEILAQCSPIGRQLLGAKTSHLGYHIPSEEDVPLRAWYEERFGKALLV